jgi:hypothetical protein
VVIGGLAAGAHGVVRATRDLDLVAAPDEQNMDRLADRVDLAELAELHGPD